jgi:hypothetical protein
VNSCEKNPKLAALYILDKTDSKICDANEQKRKTGNPNKKVANPNKKSQIPLI